MDLSRDDARLLRMASLLLGPAHVPVPGDVAGVVEWFGAMQSQDLASGLWSLGTRLPAYTLVDVQSAMERGEALRTWPMRGTLHLVPPRDARWMLDLMATRTHRAAATRHAQLGLDDTTVIKAIDTLGTALADGGRLTRSQAMAALNVAGIDTSGQRGYHLLYAASVRGVTCVAPNIDNEQTFALLDAWAPDAYRPDRDEALAILARRYFRSHGPTTAKDFAGWTGLTLADARRGIAVAGKDLASVRVDAAEMYVGRQVLDAYAPRPRENDDIRVLPGFDEYLLGYKDRSLMADATQLAAIVPGGNGVFQSTIVQSGRVIGIWKRTIGKARATIEVTPLAETPRARVERAFSAYAGFLGLPVEIRWP